jgi:hypothetical protein
LCLSDKNENALVASLHITLQKKKACQSKEKQKKRKTTKREQEKEHGKKTIKTRTRSRRKNIKGGKRETEKKKVVGV